MRRLLFIPDRMNVIFDDATLFPRRAAFIREKMNANVGVVVFSVLKQQIAETKQHSQIDELPTRFQEMKNKIFYYIILKITRINWHYKAHFLYCYCCVPIANGQRARANLYHQYCITEGEVPLCFFIAFSFTMYCWLIKSYTSTWDFQRPSRAAQSCAPCILLSMLF